MSAALSDLEELISSGTNLPADATKDLVSTLLGLSLDKEFCEQLVSKHPKIATKILHLAPRDEDISEMIIDFLINVSSHPGFTTKALESLAHEYLDFYSYIIKCFLQSPNPGIRSKAAMLLSNITRENPMVFDLWHDNDLSSLENIVKMAFKVSGDTSSEQSEDAVMVILNISQDPSCQRFLTDNLHFFSNLLSASESASEKWLTFLMGLLKNLLKNSNYHEKLLTSTDLMTILLRPLVGLHQYEGKISKDFPGKLLAYVGTSTTVSPDLRSVILECLYLLSATKSGRVSMRSCNVYDILKNISELDLLDDESDNCLDCIGLLIRTEEEIGFDDLLTVHIPEDIQEKFNK